MPAPTMPTVWRLFPTPHVGQKGSVCVNYTTPTQAVQFAEQVSHSAFVFRGGSLMVGGRDAVAKMVKASLYFRVWSHADIDWQWDN